MPWTRKTTDRWTLSLKTPKRTWGARISFACREDMDPVIEAISARNYHRWTRHRILMRVKRARIGENYAGMGAPRPTAKEHPRRKRI